MVKGNWERRAELASLRREEEKSLKAARREKRESGSKPVSAESVVTRLKKRTATISALQCWLDIPRDSENIETKQRPRGNSITNVDRCDFVCRSWLRTNFCEKKKCKFSHVASPISHLRGVIYNGDEEEEERSCCSDPVSLESLQSKDFHRLRFIAIDSQCIYDYSIASVWECYMQQELRDGLQLLSIDEGAQEDDGDEDVIAELIEDHNHELEKNLGFSNVMLVKRGAGIMLTVVLSFLTVSDIFGRLVLCNRDIRRKVLGDLNTRERKRDSFGVHSAIFSKDKKLERKKKAKNSFLPAKDKVDAFARGISR